MNTDIRISVCFPTHTKTKKLKRILGSDGVLALITLWAYAAQNRPDGALTGMAADDIAIASGWEGDEDEFITALEKIGWIEQSGGVYILHDWEENNPWAADAVNRSERAKKAAEKRWARAKTKSENDEPAMPDNASRIAECMPEALPDAQSSNAPFLSLPSLTSPIDINHGGGQTPRAQIGRLYCQAFEKVTVPSLAWKQLDDILTKYPMEQIEEAFGKLVCSTGKTLSYLIGILEGNGNEHKQKGGSQYAKQPTRNQPTSSADDEDPQYANFWKSM